MILSFITPAYNASQTIGETLAAVFAPALPDEWELDVIVVDDGSADGAQLHEVLSGFAGVRLIERTQNGGKIAAVNAAVPETRGDVVIILDADDTLVPRWPEQLQAVLADWPPGAPLCFSACQRIDGATTVADPDYTGPLSFDDILNERHMGEYLPLFHGTAIRASGGYRDPGRSVGCELWTYLTYAQSSDLWISATTLRIYKDQTPGSMSSALFTRQGAARMVDCYDYVFGEFEDAYQAHSPRNLGRRRLRQAVFAAIAGQRGKAWTVWQQGARLNAPVETLAALVLITLGPKAINALVSLAKKLNLIRRYG